MIQYLQNYEINNEKLTVEECEYRIRKILSGYKYVTILEELSSIANYFGASFSPKDTLKLQSNIFSFLYPKNRVIIHRRATATLFQFAFSISPSKYGKLNSITRIEIYRLYLLTNEFLDYKENIDDPSQLGLSLFYTSCRSVQFTDNGVDLRAKRYFFTQYYQNIPATSCQDYDNVIYSNLGKYLYDMINIFEDTSKRKWLDLYKLFEKFAVLDINDIHHNWSERIPSLDIPYSYAFLEKYPLLKHNGHYLLTDFMNLISLCFTHLYNLLYEAKKNEFKQEFGKTIVEPVIQKFIDTTFCDKFIRAIKIQKKGYEYCDFGLLYDDKVFLFEIKSKNLRKDLMCSKDIGFFEKHLDQTFISGEGITQQINSLIKIDSEYRVFCENAGIPLKSYKFYPILLCYDETMHAYCANYYMSTQFQKLKNGFIPNNFEVGNHITITFNDLYFIYESKKKKTAKINMLIEYARTIQPKPIIPYLQNKKLI